MWPIKNDVRIVRGGVVNCRKVKDSIEKEFVMRFFLNFAQLLITPCTSKISNKKRGLPGPFSRYRAVKYSYFASL